MTAVWIILRIVIFVAVLSPILYLVIRRYRLARQVPPTPGQRAGIREAEAGRGATGEWEGW
ncbi:MAG: hypothetical protein ACLFRV_08650 [Acidimicrobiales bacterium]